MQATRRSQDRCSSLDRNTALQRSLDSTTDCSGLRKSIDESLQFIRMQVDSLGLAAVSEVDVLPEVVPPPPEFTAAQGGQRGVSQCPPPPQFSDHLHHAARTTIPQLTPQQHGECEAVSEDFSKHRCFLTRTKKSGKVFLSSFLRLPSKLFQSNLTNQFIQKKNSSW